MEFAVVRARAADVCLVLEVDPVRQARNRNVRPGQWSTDAGDPDGRPAGGAIGNQTANRDYVKYEIKQSIARGDGIFGVMINLVENSKGETDKPGSNPLPSGYKVYKWVADDGYENFGTWVEQAAKTVGR